MHQNPVLQSIQECQSLLRQHTQNLRPEDLTKLTELQSELRSRYDNLATDSINRNNKLRFAVEDLPKHEEEVADIETWLQTAEQNLETSLASKSKAPEVLKKELGQQRAFTEDVIAHAADLKFVVKGGQKVLDSAKVRMTVPEIKTFFYV